MISIQSQTLFDTRMKKHSTKGNFLPRNFYGTLKYIGISKNHTNQIITDNKALEIYFKTVLLHMFNLSFIKIKANNIK